MSDKEQNKYVNKDNININNTLKLFLLSCLSFDMTK